MNRKIMALSLVLALILVIVVPLSAFASTLGTTQVQGALAATYTLSVPTDFSFSPFTIAGGTKSGQTLTATVGGGSETKVTITAEDLTGNLGFLKNGGTPLSTALHLQIGATDVTLSGSPQALVTDGPIVGGTWTTSLLTITQPAFSQVAAGTYTTTITFTATFNP